MSHPLLIVTGSEVRGALRGMEHQVVDAVRTAYELHAAERTVLPQSTFVRVPGSDRGRAIALPGYLAAPVETLGIKWIGSFPANLKQRQERASAVIVLNSTTTGQVHTLMEGAEISAARTAASAALAASLLKPTGTCLGIFGAGRISFEVVRYCRSLLPQFTDLTVYDLDRARAQRFCDVCADHFGAVAKTVGSAEELLEAAATTVFATSASNPHVVALPASRDARTILHLSLRDLTADLTAQCRNIVDDVEHVCREQTSVDLAVKQYGHRDFIAGTLADLLHERVPARVRADETVVFSPFGLGVLDLAVASLVRTKVAASASCRLVPDFIAPPLLC